MSEEQGVIECPGVVFVHSLGAGKGHSLTDWGKRGRFSSSGPLFVESGTIALINLEDKVSALGSREGTLFQGV